MKVLKKQNKMLFKIAKKSSSRREMTNINNINKARYYYSIRGGSSVSINFYSSYSSIFPLSYW